MEEEWDGRARSLLFVPSKGHTWADGRETTLVPLCPMIIVEGPLQGGLSRFHVRELPEHMSLILHKLQIAADPGVSS